MEKWSLVTKSIDYQDYEWTIMQNNKHKTLFSNYDHACPLEIA